ncbi:UTRA domain-containing protein [Roseibium algae]|uniref:UTRA domain-containing protein n=1 Tax=Roseibium algae TaxID=3123038 RepID=A0ABU8TP82_9HYPH
MTAKEANSWTRIRGELLRRINERVWQPGDLIPGEVDLAEEFGCARTTVNRALRDLADSGLVTRKRKAGTRVAVNPPHKATLTIPIIRADVEARGCVYRHALVTREERYLPHHLGGAFRLPEGAQLLYTETMHYADDRPFIFEERYTNVDTVPAFGTMDFEDISANEWLVQNTPYSGGDMVFFAANADETLARYFDTAPGTAVFAIERTTWDGSDPITHVRMTYTPGYRMRTQI